MTIRTAQTSDAATVAELCSTLGYPVTESVMRERLRSIFDSTNDVIYVAVGENMQILGWLQAHAAHILESGFRVEIVGLIVSAACRRNGVGRKLVEAAESWAKNKAAINIVVRTNIVRPESQLFYPAIGYKENKVQRVYKKPLASQSNPRSE